MSGRCVELREMSPGVRKMVTSGGESEECRVWTLYDGISSGDFLVAGPTKDFQNGK